MYSKQFGTPGLLLASAFSRVVMCFVVWYLFCIIVLDPPEFLECVDHWYVRFDPITLSTFHPRTG